MPPEEESSISRIEAKIDRLIVEIQRSNDLRQAWLDLTTAFLARVASVIDQPPVKWSAGAIAVVSTARLLGVDLPLLMEWFGRPGV